MAAPAPGPAPDYLVIDSPGDATVRLPLERNRYTLGRSAANDLVFPADQKLSREHLVFERTPESWTVRDAGSRNGTCINGARLTNAALLAHGDHITAGHLSIRYGSRHEFTRARPNEITFIEEGLQNLVLSVSVDLKSVLASSADLRGSAVMENAHLSALVRAGRELGRQGGPDKLSELILDLTIDAVKATRGVVMTRDNETTLRKCVVRGEGLRSISTGVRDAVMNDGKSILIRDARLDQELGARPSIVAQEIRSILAVPLQTDERIFGLLYLDSPFLVREFTPEDLNLVTVMANMAAIRMEHARLIEEEQARRLLARDLERAAEIQRRLLPAVAPEIAGFDLAGYNAPCRTVGGDYYDFLPYRNGRVAILIGDVSGKGLGAALLMSSLQARAQVLFESHEPFESQFCRLNCSIAGHCPSNSFITFFAAVLDPASGELVYGNAGHNPPLLIRIRGDVESLGATGIPLGIAPHAAYQMKTCRMKPGDVLVLFSDGVTESCAPGTEEEFGEERLLASIHGKFDERAADLIQAINSELLSFTQGAPASDDITLAVVRRAETC
jgi:serine phosphatase RsbU (regulator of sigma subunit)